MIAASRLILGFIQGRFVYLDSIIANCRSRNRGDCRIRGQVHGNCCCGPVSVAVLDGIAEGILDIILDVHGLARLISLQRIGIRAICIQCQIAILALYGRTNSRCQLFPGFSGRNTGHHMGALCVVSAKYIIGQNIGHSLVRSVCLCLQLAKIDRVRKSCRHVVHDLHTNDPAAGIAITVRGGNDHLVSNGIVAGLTLFMFIRGPLQMEGVVQPTRRGIVTVDYKIAFIRGHMVAGQLTVFVDDCAINGNGSHTIRRGHGHTA